MATDRLTDATTWARRLETPLRVFVRTEVSGAIVLLGAVAAALIWVNVDSPSYEDLWHTELSVGLGGEGVSLPLREWVNSGLMTFFFFVLGLEARRELDLGELRERRRFALPAFAAVGGMGAAVARTSAAYRVPRRSSRTAYGTTAFARPGRGRR